MITDVETNSYLFTVQEKTLLIEEYEPEQKKKSSTEEAVGGAKVIVQGARALALSANSKAAAKAAAARTASNSRERETKKQRLSSFGEEGAEDEGGSAGKKFVKSPRGQSIGPELQEAMNSLKREQEKNKELQETIGKLQAKVAELDAKIKEQEKSTVLSPDIARVMWQKLGEAGLESHHKAPVDLLTAIILLASEKIREKTGNSSKK